MMSATQLRGAQRYSFQERVAWVHYSRTRVAVALGHGACRSGWLFSRNLQSTGCAAEATDSRPDPRDWPQIWNGIQIAGRRLFRDRLLLCDLLQKRLNYEN